MHHQYRVMFDGTKVKTRQKPDQIQLEVFLLIDFCQTLLALLMVQCQPLLVLKHLLLRFHLAYHIIERLTHKDWFHSFITGKLRNTASFPFDFTKHKILWLTWSLILCLMMSSSCSVVSSVIAGAGNQKIQLYF